MPSASMARRSTVFVSDDALVRSLVKKQKGKMFSLQKYSTVVVPWKLLLFSATIERQMVFFFVFVFFVFFL